MSFDRLGAWVVLVGFAALIAMLAPRTAWSDPATTPVVASTAGTASVLAPETH